MTLTMSRSVMQFAAVFASISSQAIAKPGDCFRMEEDPVRPNHFRWTLTETANVELIWNQGNRKITLRTGSGGSGIPWRIAVEPDGTVHGYRMVRDVLLFDQDVYEPGCP